MGDGNLCMSVSWRHNWKWFSCILAASRMVDHWITNQRAQSGTSSPVRETESITPPAAKKNLKIQTTVSKDKPQTTSSHKTLSQRCVAFFYILWWKLIRYFTNIFKAVNCSKWIWGNSHVPSLFRRSLSAGISEWKSKVAIKITVISLGARRFQQ